MDAGEIIESLNSDTRRFLLILLHKHKGATMQEILTEFSATKTLARENVYKHLEILVESGLLRKEYDAKKKKLNYLLIVESIYFHITDDGIEVAVNGEKSKNIGDVKYD